MIAYIRNKTNPVFNQNVKSQIIKTTLITMQIFKIE